MTTNRSNKTSVVSESGKPRDTTKKSRMESRMDSRKAKGDHTVSEGTRTQLSKDKLDDYKDRVSADEYFVNFAPISGSSESYCSEGKYYSREMLKSFDKGIVEFPTDQRWTQRCKPAYGWEMAERLVFLVTDPTVMQQKDRLASHLKDFAKLTSKGYKINHLHSVCTILDYLVETLPKNYDAIQGYILTLFRNIAKPILLETSRDIFKYHDEITHYIGFLGYLLMRLEDDAMFDIVSDAMIWHLSAPDHIRGDGVASVRHTLIVAAPVLYQTISRMLAVATSHRFPTFLKMALLLACSQEKNCIELMKENIVENIFYRFNPYFPDRKLAAYDINPADPQDINVKLGDSGVHMRTTLNLLLVLLKTVKNHLVDNPKDILILPCPDYYSQRCFVWAYRFECRGRERQRERNTLTVIAMALVHCFGDRLRAFSSLLMADILTLSVITELPPRNDWTSGVNFNTAQQDVQFKKLVIYFSIDLLKVFPENNFMVESRHWLLGLMYLLDPGLCYLRARWSPALFAELRKTALQALVCAVPRLPHKLVKEHGLPRRILWYIEWYSESPYELPILYWCVRLLHVAIYHRCDEIRRTSLKDLYDTHGIIILIHLCNTLLEQKSPPVEMAQVIMGFCLRLLTSAVESNRRIVCCVYPNIKWPSFINPLSKNMLDMVLFSLEKHYILSDRWLIALLNFIWEGVIWQPENRKKFVAKDGIYKLLDLISVSENKMLLFY